MLKFCLVENPMAKDEKNFVAVVSSIKTVGLEELLQDMVDEGTGLTRPQALAYFEKMTQLTKRYLEKGFFVTTPLFRYRTSITGTFDTKLDFFDATKHTLKISSTAGPRIRQLSTVPPLTKVSVSKTSPEIIMFTDSITDECNSIATPGEMAMIEGTNLKFDKKDLKQGIFFVPVADPTTEYRASGYSGIKPSVFHLRVPELEEGDYKVVIRANTPNDKEMVDGTLDAVISI